MPDIDDQPALSPKVRAVDAPSPEGLLHDPQAPFSVRLTRQLTEWEQYVLRYQRFDGINATGYGDELLFDPKLAGNDTLSDVITQKLDELTVAGNLLREKVHGRHAEMQRAAERAASSLGIFESGQG